ncbi:MAG: tetratricopeptide repeat protein [Pirellulales bacterium]|nr:tetratricopeptide repeat protein [Pirellulales bacterium]
MSLYQAYLKDQDSAAFIKRVAERYTVGSLSRLASHSRRSVRRAAVLALGFLGDWEVNSVLGAALRDRDRMVRYLAANSIRSVWRRQGSEVQRQQLRIVVRLNSSRQYAEAIARATELLRSAPWMAEAWNQRAIAAYQTGRYVDALRDCHEALELNPYHFDAATGMAQCYLRMGMQQEALTSLSRALKLNPDLEAVRQGIARLKRALERG